MEKTVIKEMITGMPLDEKKKLRKELSEQIKIGNRQNAIHLEVYIQAKYADAVESAKQWAYENGLITRNTKWTFAKFCIINTTRMILTQKDAEKTEKLRQEQIANSQRQAQPAYDNQNGTKPPYNHQR